MIVYPTRGGIGIIGIDKALSELRQLGWIRGHLLRLVAVQAADCKFMARSRRGHVVSLRLPLHVHGADTFRAALDDKTDWPRTRTGNCPPIRCWTCGGARTVDYGVWVAPRRHRRVQRTTASIRNATR